MKSRAVASRAATAGVAIAAALTLAGCGLSSTDKAACDAYTKPLRLAVEHADSFSYSGLDLPAGMDVFARMFLQVEAPVEDPELRQLVENMDAASEWMKDKSGTIVMSAAADPFENWITTGQRLVEHCGIE